MKQLLPHQIEDAEFLASKSFAGNFSGMGSGKTLSALEAIRLVIRATAPHRAKNPKEALAKVVRSHLSGSFHKLRVIVVGPPISLNMWKEEALEFFPDSTAQIVRSGVVTLEDANFFIMSYQIATKRRDELKALGAKVLICDESHALKTISSKRTKAIIGRHGLCESVDHTWCLTGTPSTRYSDDLFGFLARADNSGLKEQIGKVDMARFRLRYCVTQKKKFSASQRFPVEVVVGNRNLEELNSFIFDRGLAVRRELKEVWEAMPPITINHLKVGLDIMDPELRQLLKAVEKQTMSQLQQDIANKEEHISTLRRKLGVAKVKHSVAEIVDRIEAGIKPILVGAVHHDVIDALHDALFAKGIVNVGVIDGRTNSNTRDVYIESFQNGTLDILIGQIQAMGVAINLQGGSHIVCVETTFSPAEQDQFYARCHRLGQANHVHVDVFEADTRLEKAVRRILATKARGHKTMMDQGAAA